MFTIQDYIDQLKIDKQNLVDNLVTKGISATSDETFTSLVPKVLDITILNAQSKSETITTNTTTTFTPDNGYNALSSIEITTNVQPILQSKSETITTNTTTTFTPDNGYDGLSSVSVTTAVAPDLSPYFSTTITEGNQFVDGWTNIVLKLPENLTISGTSAKYMFNDFKGTTLPTLDTHLVTDFSYFASNCFNLTTLPVYNLSSATNLTSMFSSTNNLSYDSIDNILQMCISATSYTGTKSLYAIGLRGSSYSWQTIQALPHWNDFSNAGWTIGW